jgi:hypothetical protein
MHVKIPEQDLLFTAGGNNLPRGRVDAAQGLVFTQVALAPKPGIA